MLDKGTCKREIFLDRDFFFFFNFFLLKKECALFVESFQREESLLLGGSQKEDTLGKVLTLELCVSIILRGGRSIRLAGIKT